MRFFLLPIEKVGIHVYDFGVDIVYYLDLVNIIMNTFLLFSSGLCSNVFCCFFVSRSIVICICYICISIVLGLIFLGNQLYEFLIFICVVSCGCYSSVFLMLDCLHFCHVYLGLIFLSLCLYRCFFVSIVSSSFMILSCLFVFY